MGADASYIFNTDPISIWLANQKTMNPKLAPVIKMVGEEFDKIKPGVAIRSAHVGIGASNTYVFMDDVLPRAIKKYGGVDPEALRKAALDTDIPRAAPCSASASSSTARARRWRARTSARSRS